MADVSCSCTQRTTLDVATSPLQRSFDPAKRTPIDVATSPLQRPIDIPVWKRTSAPNTASHENPTGQGLETSSFKVPVSWTTFDRYERIAQISGGTHGKIYKARDQLTGGTVVVKWAPCENGWPPNTMMREISALRHSRHSNIIYLLAVLYDTRSVGIVMAQAQQDLKTAISSMRPGTISVGIAKLYISQLLDGLRYLHETRRIVHLDLKPENILLNQDHRLRIADFGLARPIGAAGRQRTVVTMAYRAPEVFFRTTEFSEAVDIFAVGVNIAEMVGGVPWAHHAWQPFPCFQHMLNTLGCPDGELWPGSDLLPGVWFGEDWQADEPSSLARSGYRRFEPRPRLMDFPCRMDDSSDLAKMVSEILVLDPCKRPTAKSLKRHSAFVNDPKPAKFGTLPLVKESHRAAT
ncbi:hypothetical protein CF319_g7056 [Tilletia indica]|nr:hypothetical protein CF319_g7056 [Tilletia indica]